MSNLDKLNSIITGKKSSWREEAAFRTRNESWLSYSFDIAVRVLDTLRENRMTQKDLADKMDVTPQFISKLVKGQENLSLETIGKLSHALGVELIEVVSEVKSARVAYDLKNLFQVWDYQMEIVEKAVTQPYVGLKAYSKEELLEYKMQA